MEMGGTTPEEIKKVHDEPTDERKEKIKEIKFVIKSGENPDFREEKDRLKSETLSSPEFNAQLRASVDTDDYIYIETMGPLKAMVSSRNGSYPSLVPEGKDVWVSFTNHDACVGLTWEELEKRAVMIQFRPPHDVKSDKPNI